METRVSYGITQLHLSPNRDHVVAISPQPKLVLDLSTLKRGKAEMTWASQCEYLAQRYYTMIKSAGLTLPVRAKHVTR